MIINNGKNGIGICVVKSVMIFLCAVILLVICEYAVMIPMILVLIIALVIYNLCEYISICKTVIISKEGITVKFLKYSKTYLYEELETKVLVDNTFYTNYQETVVFYHKKMKRAVPRFGSVDEYATVFHPLSYIYLNVLPRRVKNPANTTCFFEVDRDTLMKVLDEFSVKLDHEKIEG